MKGSVSNNSESDISPEIIRLRQRSNEKYQRELKEYLVKFRNEQKAIADRFEETYHNLLVEIEKKNKESFLNNVENLAETVLKENRRNQDIYQGFEKLRNKLRNDWMFPGKKK
jgi:rhamnogalacturonyl hydrolase YesR